MLVGLLLWVWAPLILVLSDGVFGCFDLAALRGCHISIGLSGCCVDVFFDRVRGLH
jgi:hypothetical protein